ncbi:MAG: nucleoside 2-deoxyribosyltransferase domain-containing protein [Myxococcota bacterium]
MIELQPPAETGNGEEPRVFLAGSIEMGSAPNWQSRAINALSAVSRLVVLNPRRDDWDASWEQSARHEPFRSQVTWELDGIESADLVLFYFAPGTRAPITLLELGLCAGQRPILVCCPEGFWRKGNVDIVCERFGIERFESLEALLQTATERLLDAETH